LEIAKIARSAKIAIIENQRIGQQADYRRAVFTYEAFG